MQKEERQHTKSKSDTHREIQVHEDKLDSAKSTPAETRSHSADSKMPFHQSPGKALIEENLQQNNLSQKINTENNQEPGQLNLTEEEEDESSLTENEYNSLAYQAALNQLIIYSDTDSDDSNKTSDTIPIYYSTSDTRRTNDFEEIQESEILEKNEKEKELTGCELYMKHGLIFKKNFNCGNQSCNICSENKLCYKKYFNQVGHQLKPETNSMRFGD